MAEMDKILLFKYENFPSHDEDFEFDGGGKNP